MARGTSKLTRSEFLKLTAGTLGSTALARSAAAAMLGRRSDNLRDAVAADTILRGGLVATMDASDTVAQALALKDGRILAVGTDQEANAFLGPATKIVELGGRTVTPGMIDTHLHFQVCAQMGGFYTPFVPPDVTTLAELQDVLAEVAARTAPGDWVKGYYLTTGSEDIFTKWDLDPYSGGHPVFIMHQGGHWASANSAALAAAGITDETESPVGGIIERDSAGEATGVLYNHRAMDLVRRWMPRYTDERIREGIIVTQPLFASWGVTSYHDNNIRGAATVADYQQVAKEGKMTLRSTLYITLEYPTDLEPALNDVEHYEDDMCRFAGAKFLIDGQVPTAYCHEPHNGASWETTTWEISSFKQTVKALHDAGLQVSTHCVGDAAVDLVLDAYEEAMDANPRPDPRHRLEHVILTKAASTQRMKDLGVVISAQPHFIRQGGDSYEGIFGAERMDRIIVTREWLEAGVKLAISSDAPTTIWYRPQVTLAMAMARRTAANATIGEDQILTVHEALRAHTIDAAYAGHEEDERGSLEVGKQADLAVWRDDPYSLYAKDLQNALVDLTMVGGTLVYQAPRGPRPRLSGLGS